MYREVKVGAVFAGEPGPERSELVPGVFVDRAGRIQYVARRGSAEAFGLHLYALAQHCGLSQAQQIVEVWHAREHVWKGAHAVFGRSSAKAAASAKQGCDLLTKGEVEELIL